MGFGKFLGKVAQDRTTLGNPSAHLEEYQEEYPDICAIIFDDEWFVDVFSSGQSIFLRL